MHKYSQLILINDFTLESVKIKYLITIYYTKSDVIVFNFHLHLQMQDTLFQRPFILSIQRAKRA